MRFFYTTIAAVLLSSCFGAAGSAVDKVKLRMQLIKHEGLRLKVYKDSEGIPTIGVGFNLRRTDARKKIEGLGLDFKKILIGTQSLTKEQAIKLLNGDMEQSIKETRSVFPSGFNTLSEPRQHVLVDMMFNLGKPKFLKFKKMIKAVNAKNFARAAAEMKNSKWCGQVKTRCETLMKMMKDG